MDGVRIDLEDPCLKMTTGKDELNRNRAKRISTTGELRPQARAEFSNIS